MTVITVEQEGDDLVLPIPDDILQELGWEEGEELEWEISNGAIILKKPGAPSACDTLACADHWTDE